MKIDWPGGYPGGLWMDEREEAAVLDVLRNGSLFRYYGIKPAKHVDAFEAAAREFYGKKHALAVGSGTGALTVAMAALDIGPGCEVIVPAFMWVSTIGAVVQANAIPVLCEVDDSFTMDPRDLEKKITPRTKLIAPVHMCGAPSDMEAIMRVADRHNIPVLEDCAQANGGSFRGRKLGTFGRVGIYSLQFNKNMTSGEGGLIITDDDKLASRLFSAHDMGCSRVNGKLAPPEPFAQMWGQGRRMTEICGALATVQLSKLPDIVSHMNASKKKIKEMLRGVKGLGFRRINDAAGDSAQAMILILENEERAIQVAKQLADDGLRAERLANFGQHVYYNVPPLVGKVPISTAGNPWNLAENRQSVYDYNKGACPNSDALFARSVWMTIPSKLTPALETAAAENIRSAMESAALVGV